MTRAKNMIPVMPEFQPVIIRDHMLCLGGRDDGEMLVTLYTNLLRAVQDLTTGDALRVARDYTAEDTGVRPPVEAVVAMYRHIRNQKGETR